MKNGRMRELLQFYYSSVLLIVEQGLKRGLLSSGWLVDFKRESGGEGGFEPPLEVLARKTV